jgi:hypothetical protein
MKQNLGQDSGPIKIKQNMMSDSGHSQNHKNISEKQNPIGQKEWRATGHQDGTLAITFPCSSAYSLL